MKNTLFRNPYAVGEHDILFFGHQRRKLQKDGYWWDIYCDPIYERGGLDYVHFESPNHLSHRTPAKTEKLRYRELIEYTGSIQQKLGLRTPSIPDDIADRLEQAKTKICQQFGADFDLIEMARKKLHVRRTTLPLYEYLLDRTEPELVVLVVAYGDETLIEACKRKDIPTVELQHGVIHGSHTGYNYPVGESKFAFPDYLLTFGEFWTENTQFPIPDNCVIPVGYPYLEERLDAYNDIEPSEQILFVSQGTIGHELSKFALEVHEDDRINHNVVYKLHPDESNHWETEYPWLVESDVRVIDESNPSLYQLFAESSVQVGVGSTAVYEGLCFDLQTLVFDIDGKEVLQPLVEDESASIVEDVDKLIAELEDGDSVRFDRERFFKSNAIDNVIKKIDALREGTINNQERE
jgi:hypothetical protein